MNDLKLSELFAIAKGQTARDKELAKLSERVKKLAADAAQLATDLAKFINASAPAFMLNGPAPKAKRMAIKVMDIDKDAVFHVLNESPLSMGEVARAVPRGKRTIGAALRALVAEGKAIEKPRGKFSAAPVRPAEEGADA